MANHRAINTNHGDGAMYFDAAVSCKLPMGDRGQAEAFLNVRDLTNLDSPIVDPG